MGIFKFLNLTSESPKRIFLIDAIGALVTAILLLGILAMFQSTFGMPRPILFMLSGVAIILCCYSTFCYLTTNAKHKMMLQLLIMFNSFYIILSVGMVILYSDQLTVLGYVYFILEIIVIAIVITIEYRASQFLKNQ